MIDTAKWNISYIGEKVIKPMYEDGTFPLTLADEIKNAIEKQIPHKPNEDDCCTTCNTYLKDDNGVEGDYCPNCGQAIDWSVEE